MASIRKRGPHQWQAQIVRKGFPSRSRTFINRSDALKWARAVEAEMDRSLLVHQEPVDDTTLYEALERYEREITPQKKGAHQESMRIRIWKRHPLSKRILKTIQGKDIASYRDERLKEAAPNTVRHELALLSHVFTIALKEWGMTGLENPVLLIRMPKSPPGRDRRLKDGELERILAASQSAILPDIARLALETAMRQGEIAGMLWRYVDLGKRTVTLPDTKNGDRRIVPLSLEAVRILSGLSRRPDGKLWDLFSPQAIAVSWRRAVARARTGYEKECRELGIEPDPAYLVDMTFHDLRHEATSRFFEKGLNPMQVATITGHKSLQMLKRYTHLRAEDLARMLDR
jgi:integrase